MKLFLDPIRVGLVLIMLLAVILRFGGVSPGYNSFHPDEGKDGMVSALYMFTNGNLNPMDYNYPSLIPLVELLVLILIVGPLECFDLLVSNPGNAFHNLTSPSSMYQNVVLGLNNLQIMYWGRYITAFFGVLTVFLTYQAGKRLFESRLTGLFSALVLCLNFRAVMNSHLDLPDIYNSFFLLLAAHVMFSIIKKSSYLNYVLSGIVMAFSFSAKLQFFSFVAFAFLHLYRSVKYGRSLLGKFKLFLSPKLIVSVGVLVICVFLINFYEIKNLPFFIETIAYEAKKNGLWIFQLDIASLSYFYKIAITPFVFWTVLLGVIKGLKDKFLTTSFLLSVILPFSLYFFYVTQAGFYSRNFVTILPIFALLAGNGLAYIFIRLGDFIKVPFLKFLIFGAVLVIILFSSAVNSFVNTVSYRQPWSLTDMRFFLSSNIKEGSVIASHPWDWYTLISLPAIDVRQNLSRSQLDYLFSYSLQEIQSAGADYAIIGTDVLSDAASIWWLRGRSNLFWQKPDFVSKNTFSALSANELLENSLHVSVKPWQAPDNNYVFVGIPPKINTNYRLIFSLPFNSKEDINLGKLVAWKEGFLSSYDSEDGFRRVGSKKLAFIYSKYPFIRWVSPTFEVKEGYAYKTKVWVKTQNLVDIKNRDGFLRLDFYETNPLIWDAKTNSDKTAVSSRYFGNEWKEIEVEAIAPSGTNLATFSFQISRAGNIYWLDDIEIFESISKVPLLSVPGSFKYQLPDNILVPYTNGNL